MARSSAYGNILSQIPDWVFGGEYGDIANVLNKRDAGYEQLQAQEIQNEKNNMLLEDAKRQEEMDRRMRESGLFTDGKQPTIGEMYDMKRKMAMQYGGIDDVLSIEKELAAIKDRQEKEARQKILEQRQDEEWGWKKERKGRTGEEKKEKTVEMYNPETDDFVRVPESQVGAARKLNYIDNDHPRLQEMILEAQARKDKSKKQESSSSPFWEDPPPMVAPSPTPLARGDRARQTPAPDDQVAVITRKRTKAVKGD